MNTENIRDRPCSAFKPSVMEMSGDRRHRVPHPGFVITGRTVVVVMREGESVATIDPLPIDAIEDFRNSRRRKR